MKLLLITASTNLEKGLVFKINTIDATETKNVYTYTKTRVGLTKCETDIEDYSKRIYQKRRIGKDRLLKVDTVTLNTNGAIRYYTYCLPEDKEKAIEILYEAVNKLYEELSDKFVKLQKSMLVAWSKGIRQLSEEAQERDSIFVS